MSPASAYYGAYSGREHWALRTAPLAPWWRGGKQPNTSGVWDVRGYRVKADAMTAATSAPNY